MMQSQSKIFVVLGIALAAVLGACTRTKDPIKGEWLYMERGSRYVYSYDGDGKSGSGGEFCVTFIPPGGSTQKICTRYTIEPPDQLILLKNGREIQRFKYSLAKDSLILYPTANEPHSSIKRLTRLRAQ